MMPDDLDLSALFITDEDLQALIADFDRDLAGLLEWMNSQGDELEQLIAALESEP